MNTKMFGGLCILVLIAGMGSFALQHSAYAQTVSSDIKLKTKVDIQKEDRAKALDKLATKEKENSKKSQHFKDIASKLMKAKFKINYLHNIFKK